jgi:putative DNA methylase
MVNDPSSRPDVFTTEEAQERERQRLFSLLEDLVQWENSIDEATLTRAKDEIWRSWRETCAANADQPNAKRLFDPKRLPSFCDPFCGGGALPLEAQRLGLESYASDLNPVAVLITKGMIEIPPRFSDRLPINPKARNDKTLVTMTWRHARGLAEDVRFYGGWMCDEAKKRIGHLYPTIKVSSDMVRERPDLNRLIGKNLTVIAWIWARTVKSQNPAFRSVDVPLASSFVLSTKVGKEAYVQPVIEDDHYKFIVKIGKPSNLDATRRGTKAGTAVSGFTCLLSGTPMPFAYIRSEAKAGRMGARLMAVVAEGNGGRVYLSPTPEIEAVAQSAEAKAVPETELPAKALGFRIQEYGMTRWRDLFTPRQLVALTTLSDLVREARVHVEREAVAAGMANDGVGLEAGGSGAAAYADAIATYLAFLVDQVANHSSSACGWNSANAQMRSVFARQAIPMVWDFAESNPFCSSSGSYSNLFERQIKAFTTLDAGAPGRAYQLDAQTQSMCDGKVVSTDPPYYDNIAYADLSDFFYVWLRRSLGSIVPNLLSTLTTPKTGELVANPYRHGGKDHAEIYFVEHMTAALRQLAEHAHPGFPVTIYYAFKQSESETDMGTVSTGWETFLEAVMRAGFTINGTWPMRTEKEGRVRSNESNALASSVVLVCRARNTDARTATRREFLIELREEMPIAIARLQKSNIAPVDLAQSVIGPGMAVYSRFEKVLNVEGKSVSVGEALALINQAADEVLAEQEGDFDADTRWALAWFQEFGFAEADYGVAESLSKAKNTSVAGLVDAGILTSKSGKVRLLRPENLSVDWDPNTDPRFTVWEVVHHLIRVLEKDGESAAAELMAKIGSRADTARELPYRLYTICERKKRTREALSYNGLVQSWPEIKRLARADRASASSQTQMFEQV